MKKIILLTAAASLSFGLSACSSANNGLNPKNVQNQSFELSNRTEPGNAKNPRSQEDVDQGRFGFVRVHEAPNGKSPKPVQGHDFEDLANKVALLTVNMPNVHDVAALVTSHEALVGYHTDSTNRKQTAEQIKLSAQNVLPSFYDVYVTDDPTLIKDIQRLQNAAPTKDIEQMLASTIQEMKKHSPQGMGKNKKYPPNNQPKNEMGTDSSGSH